MIDLSNINSEIKGLNDTFTSVKDGFHGLMDSSIAFERSLINLGVSAKANSSELRGLEKQALELGRATKYSSKEVVDAMGILASSGFKTNELYSVTNDSIKLATVGQMELAKSSDILAGAIAGFGLSASDSNRVIDVLSATASNSGTNIQALSEALSLTSKSAKVANASFEEVSAIAGTLENAGVEAKTAGKAMNEFFTTLNSPSEKALKVFKELKIDPENLNNFGTLTELFNEIINKSQNLPPAEQLNIANRLFGREYGDEAFIFMQEFNGKYRELMESVKNADALDVATKLYQELSNNLDTSLKKMENSFENLKIKATTPLLEPFKEQVDEATALINSFADSVDFKAIGESVATLIGYVDDLIIAYGAFKVGGWIVKGVEVLKNSVFLLESAMLALRTAVMTNPLLFAVSGAIFIGTEIFKNWDDILEKITGRLGEIEKLSFSNLEAKINELKEKKRELEEEKAKGGSIFSSWDAKDEGELRGTRQQIAILKSEYGNRINFEDSNTLGLENLNDKVANFHNNFEKGLINLSKYKEEMKVINSEYEKLANQKPHSLKVNDNDLLKNDNCKKDLKTKTVDDSKDDIKPPKDLCGDEAFNNAKRVKSEIEATLKSINSVYNSDELDKWVEKNAIYIQDSILGEKDKYEEYVKLANLYGDKHDKFLEEEAKKEEESNKRKINEAKKTYDINLDFYQKVFKDIGDLDSAWNIEQSKLREEAIKKGFDTTSNEYKKWLIIKEKQFFESNSKIVKNTETTIDRLNKNLANSFEEGLFKSLNDGFEDIEGLVESLGDTIEKTLYKDFSNAVTNAIFGIPINEGNIFASMLTGSSSGSYNLNAELLNDGYVKQANGSYYNASTSDTIDASVINTATSNLISGSKDMLLSSENIQYGVSRLGSTLYDYNLISAETNKSIAEFGVKAGEWGSSLSSMIKTGTYMYAGGAIGSKIGSSLAPHSYADKGFGVLGAGIGAQFALGGLNGLAFMASNPVGWILAGVAALSTMFGSKYKAQEGFRFKDGMSINGKLDKEELAEIDAYTWYKKKTGRLSGSSSSKYEYRPLSLKDKSYLTSTFNTYDTFSSKLGGQSLSLEESELKQSGRGRGLTAKKLEEVLVKETLANVMGINKTIEEALENGTRTIENPDLTEVYKYYEDYAKASEKSITEVISEVFGGVIAFDADFSIKSASLYGDNIEANRLQKEGYSETIESIKDNLKVFGVDIENLDMSNLNEVENAIKNLTPTKENIEAYQTLATSIYELEKANMSYVDSISQSANISDEKLAEYWSALEEGRISEGELYKKLREENNLSIKESLELIDSVKGLSTDGIIAIAGIDNVIKEKGIDEGDVTLIENYMDNLAQQGYSLKEVTAFGEEAYETLFKLKDIDLTDLDDIKTNLKIEDIEISEIDATEKVKVDEINVTDKFLIDPIKIDVDYPKNLTVSVDVVGESVKGVNKSYDIGGFTNSNDNLDGKGGFLAILHPNEYVINSKQKRKHRNLINLLEAERVGKIDLPSFDSGGDTNLNKKKSRSYSGGDTKPNSTKNSWLDDLSYMTTPISDTNDYTPFSKKYNFNKELIDLGFIDEFKTSLKDVNLTLNDFSLDGIQNKIDELSNSVATSQEEYDKNSKAISYLTTAYLKAQSNIQDINSLFLSDDEKLNKNRKYINGLDINSNFGFKMSKQDYEEWVNNALLNGNSSVKLNLNDYDSLKSQIQSDGFQNYLNSLSPEKLEEFEENLNPVVASLKEEKQAREELIKSINDVRISNMDFIKSLTSNEFYYLGNRGMNREGIMQKGADAGEKSITRGFSNYSNDILAKDESGILSLLSRLNMSQAEIEARFTNENGEFNLLEAKKYIIDASKEGYQIQMEGVNKQKEFLKSYENFGDNFLTESDKVDNALSAFGFTKATANIEDFTKVVNGSIENIDIKDMDKFNQNSQILVNWLNSVKSSLESFSLSLESEIEAMNFDISKVSFTDIENQINNLEFSGEIGDLEKIKSLISERYNYELQQLNEQKSFILSLKSNYESLNAKYRAVNNISYTQSDLIAQIEKLKTVSDKYFSDEFNTYNTIYDSYIASLDRQIEVYDRTIESIEDLKTHIRDLRLGNLSYFTTSQKSEVAKSNYLDSIGLLKGAISGGNSEDISKYLAEVKASSQTYLSALRESGNIRGYKLEFDKVIGQIGSFTRSIGNLEVKSSEEIQAEQSGYLEQVMTILSQKQPLINDSLASIDTHFKEKELSLKETAIAGMKGLQITANGWLEDIEGYDKDIKEELVKGQGIGVISSSIASALDGKDGESIKTTNSIIADNTIGIKTLNTDLSTLGTTISTSIGSYSSATINWLSYIKSAIENLKINVNVVSEINTTSSITAGATQSNIGLKTGGGSARPTLMFNDGGFTGFDKGVNEAVGVVHGKEYVAPYKQIKKYPQLFQELERDRKGFKDGGFTTPISIKTNNSNNFSELIAEIKEMKEELKRAKKELEEIKNSSSRGSFFVEKIYKIARDLFNRLVA